MTHVLRTVRSSTVAAIVAGSIGAASTMAVSLAHAQADAPAVITPAALAARLPDGPHVLLHVGPAEGFADGHLAGARPVSLADISTPRGDGRLTLQLPDVDALRRRLAALGVTDASTIVVYASTPDGVSQATRVVFTLDYLGLGGRTLLLDGGLPAWRAAGLPIATGAPPPAAPSGSTLPTVQPRASAVALLADVEAASRTSAPRRVIVVDARAPEFYTGESDRRGEIPRPGHVPGAVNLPFSEFYVRAAPGDASSPYVLRPKAELEEMFSKVGITRDATVITYCHIGQQATVPYVVARTLGYDVRLYDGSYEEWSATPAVAVEKP